MVGAYCCGSVAKEGHSGEWLTCGRDVAVGGGRCHTVLYKVISCFLMENDVDDRCRPLFGGAPRRCFFFLFSFMVSFSSLVCCCWMEVEPLRNVEMSQHYGWMAAWFSLCLSLW